MESLDSIDVDGSNELLQTLMEIEETKPGFDHEHLISNGSFFSNSISHDQPRASTSKDQTLDELLSDLPPEVLTGCGPEEAFRPDYKEAIFPRKRPADAPVTEPTRSVFHEEETIDPEDNFYFESDHLALKGNKDYHDLLKVIVILQAQRTQAIKDLDELLLAKQKALADPIAYVAKLQNADLPEYPGPQKIAELPKIDWTKYNVVQPDSNMRPMTRHAKNAPTTVDEIIPKEKEDKKLVRGRVFDESKPNTFNQLWTYEEQKRLEALLEKYPDEGVGMDRWRKIAAELGNRTAKQVSSRVQKYFIKLHKLNQPVPGHKLKFASEIRKKKRHRMFKKSTFFPTEQILDEIKSESIQEESEDDGQSESSSAQENSELKQIELLKKIKEEKDSKNDELLYRHLGYKCRICNEEPIKDTRWHCEECLDNTDICTDCAVAQLEAENPLHSTYHKLTAVRPPKYSKYYDTDYLPQNFSSTSYNYLDPNFLPE